MGDWTEGELRLDGDDSMDGVPFIVLVAGEEGGSKHRYVADVRCQWDGDEPVLNAESRANAERLAACWNAMRGIPDPAATMKDVVEVLGRTAEFARLYALPELRADTLRLLAKLEGK
jgi:hypothetical protein